MRILDKWAPVFNGDYEQGSIGQRGGSAQRGGKKLALASQTKAFLRLLLEV